MLLVGQLFLLGGSFRKSESAVAETAHSGSVDYVMQPPKPVRDARTKPKASTGAPLASPKTNVNPVWAMGISVQEENGQKLLFVDLSAPTTFTKMNHEGKLLRLKFQPPIMTPGLKTQKEIQKSFEKFSAISGKTYSEWVFYGKGRIGNPYLATSSANLPRLIVPFRDKASSFPLPGGEELEPGLFYHTDRPLTKSGPSDAFIVRLDPASPHLSVFPVLANEGICQKEILSSMGRRYESIAAINGAYFTHRGDPIGTLIINRKLISSPLYGRSVFGISDRGLPLFGNPNFAGNLLCHNMELMINAVNQPRGEENLVVFTPEFARSTMTEDPGIELIVVKNRVVGIQKNDSIIPPDGIVLSANGEKAEMLSKVRLGDSVGLEYKISAPWDHVLHGVCGGPRLLFDGVPSINGREEKFDHSIVFGRHPRSAVALTFDGELLFVVIDGRSKRSAGMTLAELASYLKKLGARQAINLDGGGSSSMLVRGKIVNRPSDGKERPISNGILISKK